MHNENLLSLSLCPCMCRNSIPYCLQVCDQPETDNRKCHEREKILWNFSNFHVNGIQWFNIKFPSNAQRIFQLIYDFIFILFFILQYAFCCCLVFTFQKTTLNVCPVDRGLYAQQLNLENCDFAFIIKSCNQIKYVSFTEQNFTAF